MADFYSGSMRQAGGGLGGIFAPLLRAIVPAFRSAIPILKNTALPFIKKGAKRMAPHLISEGLGIMGDLASKRNLKTAVKKRGKRLLIKALGKKLRKVGVLKKRKTRRAPKRRRPGAKSKVKRRRRDIFDA